MPGRKSCAPCPEAAGGTYWYLAAPGAVFSNSRRVLTRWILSSCALLGLSSTRTLPPGWRLLYVWSHHSWAKSEHACVDSNKEPAQRSQANSWLMPVYLSKCCPVVCPEQEGTSRMQSINTAFGVNWDQKENKTFFWNLEERWVKGKKKSEQSALLRHNST